MRKRTRIRAHEHAHTYSRVSSLTYPTLLAISYDDARGLGLSGDAAVALDVSLPVADAPVAAAEGELA